MSSLNIFNRTPSIAEDTLQYNLYATQTDKPHLTALAACIQSFADGLLPGFMWHRDPFEVKVVRDEATDRWVLQGRMRVGDCVDDEWCTVWLLKQISEKWEDLVISVFDSDGEFLLIEAADALPAWVQPSNSENRVWIHSSHLHLIPLGHVSSSSKKHYRRKLPGVIEDGEDKNSLGTNDDDDFIAAEDAVSLVHDLSMDTRAPRSVENIIWKRISGYPEVARQHVHRTKAWLPEDIARALANNPSLVQRAVEAFYTRDAIQLRAANKMSRFPPSQSVLQLVKMTRTAYAQLVGQKFFPPKVFGRWSEAEGSKEWRWKDIGMKIACGFEMLYQESKSKASTSGIGPEQFDAAKEALQRDTGYQKYIESLKSAGYFKEELQGSQLWKTLEDKAAKKFIEMRQTDDASRLSFAQLVNTAVAGETAAFAIPLGEEDPDDWLNVDEEGFDSMLKHLSEPNKLATPMDVDDKEEVSADDKEKRQLDEQATRLKDFAAKIEKFVENEGDLEGARFEDDLLSDEEFSDDTDESEDEVQDKQALRQEDLDKLVKPIEASEYGVMPPSYSKSQKVARGRPEANSTRDTEAKTKKDSRPIRKPLLPRDKYEGVSDDETDSEEEEDEEDEDDRPQVVGDVEVDMDEEQEEFLEFTRQVLGISDDQWDDIVRDRMDRGAFVPVGTKVPEKKKVKTTPAAPDNVPKAEPRQPAPGPRPGVNPNLDSFEAVMEAMEVELSKLRSAGGQKTKPTTANTKAPLRDVVDIDTTKKGKGKATAEQEDEEDIELEMDAELRAALAGPDDEGDSDEEGNIDYNLIKNFLESFKSQAGLSGPVSNLAGRLQPGWQLPRDNA